MQSKDMAYQSNLKVPKDFTLQNLTNTNSSFNLIYWREIFLYWNINISISIWEITKLLWLVTKN